MKVLELFAGTKSIGNAFAKHGHEVISIDWDRTLPDMDYYMDVYSLTVKDVIRICHGRPQVIWASPDCATYSLASASQHRIKAPWGFEPVSDYAVKCDVGNRRLVELLLSVNPMAWFIENPRGMMRCMDFMLGLPRYTVTYCQYGESRQKPTDIWTNHPNPRFKPPCKRGDLCHVPTPRHTNTGPGTQSLNSAKERSRIPPELCEHIVRICEELYEEKERDNIESDHLRFQHGYVVWSESEHRRAARREDTIGNR